MPRLLRASHCIHRCFRFQFVAPSQDLGRLMNGMKTLNLDMPITTRIASMFFFADSFNVMHISHPQSALLYVLSGTISPSFFSFPMVPPRSQTRKAFRQPLSRLQYYHRAHNLRTLSVTVGNTCNYPPTYHEKKIYYTYLLTLYCWT